MSQIRPSETKETPKCQRIVKRQTLRRVNQCFVFVLFWTWENNNAKDTQRERRSITCPMFYRSDNVSVLKRFHSTVRRANRHGCSAWTLSATSVNALQQPPSKHWCADQNVFDSERSKMTISSCHLLRTLIDGTHIAELKWLKMMKKKKKKKYHPKKKERKSWGILPQTLVQSRCGS